MSNNNSGSNGGTIVWNTPLNGGLGQWITVTVPQTNTPQQMSFNDIELAVPVEKKKVSDGCSCKKCKEFFPYAEPNQEDGSLVCYGCRMIW